MYLYLANVPLTAPLESSAQVEQRLTSQLQVNLRFFQFVESSFDQTFNIHDVQLHL